MRVSDKVLVRVQASVDGQGEREGPREDLGRINSAARSTLPTRPALRSVVRRAANMATPAAPPVDFADSPLASTSSVSSPTSESLSLPETVFDPDTLVKRGWCTVATDKNRAANPHKLYYGQLAALVTCSQVRPSRADGFCAPLAAELHGQDEPTSKRLVFTMGLNNSSFVCLHLRLSLSRKRSGPGASSRTDSQTDSGVVRASRLLCTPTGIRRPRL